MKIEKTIPLFFLAGVLAVSAFGYYGGQTLNHGHTSAAGDGGPLTNPVISGTATLTGVSASTLNVSGLTTLNQAVVTQSTIKNLTATNLVTGNNTTTSLSVSTGISASANSIRVGTDATSGINWTNGGLGFDLNMAGTNLLHVTQTGGGSFGFTLNVQPQTDNTYSLGSNSHGWKKLIISNAGSIRDQADNFDWIKVGTDTATGGVQVRGSPSGDNAPAGFYGEFFSSTTVSGSVGKSSTGTNQFFDILSMTLTAGDWDISAVICGTANGATVTDFRGAVSSTSGNSATGQVDGDNVFYSNVFPGAAADQCNSIPVWRANASVSTTYYLKSKMAFSAATPKAYGRLSARRVR